MSVRLDKQGGVGVIVLDRPPANSYDYAFLRSFAGVVDDLRADEDIHAVVVTSASEKFFSAGAAGTAFPPRPTRPRGVAPPLAPEALRHTGKTTPCLIAALAAPRLRGGFAPGLSCD